MWADIKINLQIISGCNNAMEKTRMMGSDCRWLLR